MRDSLLKKVLDSVRQGDLDSFEKLYILTYKEAYNHGASYIKEETDIWNIICDVYVNLYEEREVLSGAEELLKRIFERMDEAASEHLKEECFYTGEAVQSWEVSEEKAYSAFAVIEERIGLMSGEDDNAETKDYVFSGIKAAAAIGIAALAVGIITIGVRRIGNYNSQIIDVWNQAVNSTLPAPSNDNNENLLESSSLEAISDTGEQETGLLETPEGKKYLKEDGEYLTDSWMEVDHCLYYFGEDGLAVTGEMTVENQIFEFGSDGALVWIGRNEAEPITAENSIQTVGDDTYYLRINDESSYNLYRVNETGKLAGKKELVLSGIQDYFVIDVGTESKENYSDSDFAVYFMKDGELQEQGILSEGYPIESFVNEIVKKEDAFYFENELGEPVSTESGILEIENRSYRVENGKIKYVKAGNMTANGITYYFNGSTPQTSRGIYWKNSSGQGDLFVEEGYWIDSFCLVDDWIYYSACIGKLDGFNRYSQVFRIRTDGTVKEAVTGTFKGNLINLYYYSEKNEIYAEYNPNTDNYYGRLMAISLDGRMELINDSAARVGRNTTGEDTLELIMVSGDTISCYWHDCDWNEGGVTTILWTVPIQMSASGRIPFN